MKGVRPVDGEDERAAISGPGSEKRTLFLLVRWGVAGGVERPLAANVWRLVLLVLWALVLSWEPRAVLVMLRRGRRTARGASSSIVVSALTFGGP